MKCPALETGERKSLTKVSSLACSCDEGIYLPELPISSARRSLLVTGLARATYGSSIGRTAQSVTCPRCDSSDVRPTRRPTIVDELLVTFGIGTFRCKECRHRFRESSAQRRNRRI
jgi:hypothetical protein